jgi:hypothetical protein
MNKFNQRYPVFIIQILSLIVVIASASRGLKTHGYTQEVLISIGMQNGLLIDDPVGESLRKNMDMISGSAYGSLLVTERICIIGAIIGMLIFLLPCSLNGK